MFWSEGAKRINMERIDELYRIHQDKKRGIKNYIPFEKLPKLAQYVPGLIKGTPYVITAGTGVD